jgi:hypothetical protein
VKLEPGSVVLAPAEVANLRDMVIRWEGAYPTTSVAHRALTDIAETVRSLLNMASDDERKPVVR